jgi:hypothetical protein
VTFERLRLIPTPGDGLVARMPGVALLMGSSAADSVFVDELLRLCRADQPDGRVLTRDVARLILDADPATVPPFCFVADTADGVAVLVRGSALVTVAASDSSVELSGELAATWVDRIIPATVTAISARLGTGPATAAGASANSRVDLLAGIVLGGGFDAIATEGSVPEAQEPTAPKFLPSAPATGAPMPAAVPTDLAPAADPPTSPVAETEPPFAAPAAAVPAAPAPEPIAPEPTAPAAPAPNPFAPAAEPLAPEEAPTDEAAVVDSATTHIRYAIVVGNERTRHVLDKGCVIGRDPVEDTLVRQAAATPVVLDDESRSVSRVHAEIRIRGADIVLVDRGARNGTSISPPGSGEWIRLSTNGSALLEARTYIRLGQCPIFFEGHVTD